MPQIYTVSIVGYIVSIRCSLLQIMIAVSSCFSCSDYVRSVSSEGRTRMRRAPQCSFIRHGRLYGIIFSIGYCNPVQIHKQDETDNAVLLVFMYAASQAT